MTIGEQLYLALVLAEFAVFAFTLAIISRLTNRAPARRKMRKDGSEADRHLRDAA